jgi:hypothetical protein
MNNLRKIVGFFLVLTAFVLIVLYNHDYDWYKLLVGIYIFVGGTGLALLFLPSMRLYIFFKICSCESRNSIHGGY